MATWKETTFAELLIESKDGEWGAGEESVGLRRAVVIRGTDFADLDEATAEFPRRWISDHIVARKQLIAGDIILETAGGTSTQSTGRSALVKQSLLDRFQGTPVLCASFCRHLRLNRDRYDSRFIYYLLQGLYRTGYMSVFNIQHTGVSRFQYTAFKDHTELRIPELDEQRKIAAILSAYDELIENNKHRIVLLEKMAEEIYREWFVRLRFPGRKSVQLVKGVPAGWEVKRFNEIVEYYIGGGWGEDARSPTFSEGAYVIRGTDIPNIGVGQLEACPFRFHKPSNLASRTLIAGDFVFEVSGGSKDQLLGRNLMVSKAVLDFFDAPVMAASFCKQIRFRKDVVSPLFMKYFMKLYYDHDLVGIYQVQSTGISNYQFESFLKYQTIVIPPEQIQLDFAKYVAPLVELRDSIGIANIHLRRLRDRLLPRLISGRLAVDKLDIQLPPSMKDEVSSASLSHIGEAREAEARYA